MNAKEKESFGPTGPVGPTGPKLLPCGVAEEYEIETNLICDGQIGGPQRSGSVNANAKTGFGKKGQERGEKRKYVLDPKLVKGRKKLVKNPYGNDVEGPGELFDVRIAGDEQLTYARISAEADLQPRRER